MRQAAPFVGTVAETGAKVLVRDQQRLGYLDLLRRHPVIGGDIFDLQIVAAMQANDVQRIYTYNTGDFDVFTELAVVTP